MLEFFDLDGGGTKDGVYDKVNKGAFIDGIFSMADAAQPKPGYFYNRNIITDNLPAIIDIVYDVITDA